MSHVADEQFPTIPAQDIKVGYRYRKPPTGWRPEDYTVIAIEHRLANPVEFDGQVIFPIWVTVTYRNGLMGRWAYDTQVPIHGVWNMTEPKPVNNLTFAKLTNSNTSQGYKAVTPERTYLVVKKGGTWQLTIWDAYELVPGLRDGINPRANEVMEDERVISCNTRALCYAVAQEFEILGEEYTGVLSRLSAAFQRVYDREDQKFWQAFNAKEDDA